MEAERKRVLREKEINDWKMREEEIRQWEIERARKQNGIERMNMPLTYTELDSNAGLILAQRERIKKKEDEIQLKFKMMKIVIPVTRRMKERSTPLYKNFVMNVLPKSQGKCTQEQQP